MTFTTKTIFNSLKKDGVLKIGRALDLGCGKGGDTENFVKEGFLVDAVDSDPESIKVLPISPQITPILSKIEDFDVLENTYHLISCQYVLHFLDKEISKKILEKMIAGALTEGVIAFTLLGENDEWKDKWTTWTKDEADRFLINFPVKIHKTIVEEGMGQTKAGKLKYWHVLHYVLLKK